MPILDTDALYLVFEKFRYSQKRCAGLNIRFLTVVDVSPGAHIIFLDFD